jgi:multiple sugar transport system permease protein
MPAIKGNIFSSQTAKAYFFNLPVIIIMLIFIFLPVAGTLINSLYRDVSFLPYKFIWLENYKRIFSDIHFWESVRFTALFLAVSVGLELLIALILNEVIKGSNVLKLALLVPWAIPVAISGRLWQLIYNYEFGVLNYMLIHLGFITAPVNWLGSPLGAFFSIAISDVWKTTPFITLILLTGLSTISAELYKQAMVDGAGLLQRFFYITLPLLRPVIITALLFRAIDAIRIFDLIYILTGGGPGGSTSSVSIYAFKSYVSGDFGYGSAISLVVFVIASFLAILYIKYGRYTEELK